MKSTPSPPIPRYGWLMFGIAAFLSGGVFAQTTVPLPKDAAELERKQKDLVQKLQKLEDTFLRMSELEAVSNPTHAGLLLQAAQLSKQLGTRQRLLSAGDLLAKGQLSKAVQEQESAQESLKKLLELLQSENRSSRVREERAKLEDILKDLLRIENIQRSIRGRTESGQDMKQAKADQSDLSQQLESTEKSLADPKESEAKSDSDKDEKSSEGKPKPNDENKNDSDKDKDSKNLDQQGKDQQGKDQQGKDQQGKDQQGKDQQGKDQQGKDQQGKDQQGKDQQGKDQQGKDQQGKDQQGKDQQGKDQQGKDQQGKDQQDKDQEDKDQESGPENQPDKPQKREDRARNRVQKAQKQMQEALEKLTEENRDQAVDAQMAAEKELRDAVAELEKILRQLREEEIERSLVDLETRLRRMNEMQTSIRSETERLDKLEGDARDRTLDIQANKLSIEQAKVVMEGQRALLLLQDEGSSTAFPEAMEQIIKDAQNVAKRLGQGNVGASTQAIEDEILFSLEELLESLKQVQKKREDKKRQSPGGQNQMQDQEDQPLVDNLAELRLLKTLQLRINRRTQSLAQQVDKTDDPLGQVQAPQVLEELNELAGRQQKIYDVTREMLLKSSQK